jgi:DNA-binding HxlR family transcriptional regulator
MRRKSLEAADCPVARSLDVIGDWWSLLIVRDAQRGMRRFGEFQKSLGMSKNILTRRLRSLIAHGILDSVPAADGSAYRDYVLTGKGQALFTVIVALRDWGTQNLFVPGECRTLLVDRKNGRPVRKLDVHAADGRSLQWSDTALKSVP